MLLGEVEVDRERLVQANAVIVHRRDMAVRIDLEKLRGAGVQRRARSVRIGEPIGLDHRNRLERNAELAREPVIARRARAVAAIDGEHVRVPESSCPGLSRASTF